MNPDQLKQMVIDRGYSPQVAEYLATSAPNSVRKMAALGAEQPEYLDMAAKQAEQMLGRNVNKTGGMLGSVLDWLTQ